MLTCLQGIKKPPGIDMSPVDYVSKVIVEIVVHNKWTGPVNFNVVNPNPYPYHKLFERVNQFGYPLTHLPYELWRRKFLEVIEENSNEAKADGEPIAILPVAAQFSESWINNLKNPEYSQENVKTVLKDTVPFPDVDKLINIYLSYFIRCEFLEPPQDFTAEKSKHFDWGVIGSGIQRLTRTNRT
jgi:hypothetical protein